MIENPKVGMQGWIITDLWETMCAVPVTIIAEAAERGVFVCRWQITEDYFEDYEEIWPEWLYATEEEALQKIQREKEA